MTYTPEQQQRVREWIRTSVKTLADALCSMEQTTHGTMKPGNIDQITDTLRNLWNEPSAFAASDFSQVARRFLEATKDSA